MIRTEEIIHPIFPRERRNAGDGDRLHAGQLTQSREGAVCEGQPDRVPLRPIHVILRGEQVDLRNSNVA
jgi:hypothetical protein